ncbi:PREDICTED: uncharacterized protein LOC108578226 [Habropoda laboriosa]|uniref:uncharacterized protein LOC108578226 n=1 Tax=Habropoda laboriosa TaxID=597456 RepID=UPI00083DB57B|nr:PREDICTED: uncharacterized protein LOC108578226 [Habropoda laboriosa]
MLFYLFEMFEVLSDRSKEEGRPTAIRSSPRKKKVPIFVHAVRPWDDRGRPEVQCGRRKSNADEGRATQTREEQRRRGKSNADESEGCAPQTNPKDEHRQTNLKDEQR